MLSIDTSDRAFVRIRAQGVLRWRDYKGFEARLSNELGRRHRPVPLMLDLKGFRGWSAPGLIRDLVFDLRHREAFSRIAVVGDARWHKWITYLAIPLFRVKMRFFKVQDRATEWLRA